MPEQPGRRGVVLPTALVVALCGGAVLAVTLPGSEGPAPDQQPFLGALPAVVPPPQNVVAPGRPPQRAERRQPPRSQEPAKGARAGVGAGTRAGVSPARTSTLASRTPRRTWSVRAEPSVRSRPEPTARKPSKRKPSTRKTTSAFRPRPRPPRRQQLDTREPSSRHPQHRSDPQPTANREPCGPDRAGAQVEGPRYRWSENRLHQTDPGPHRPNRRSGGR
jgi:hypothetical protein